MRTRFQLSVDLMFAAYLSLLVAFAVESRPPYAWTARGRYLYFWHPHAISLSWSDFILFYVEILLIPAILIFVCFRLVERFSNSRAFLRTVLGVVAVAAFPLVCLSSGGGLFYFGVAEAAIAAGCVLLWAYRKWPASPPMDVFLLGLHFVFWCLFGIRGFGLVIEPWAWWGLWDYMLLVLPVLGFACTLAWASYFKHSSHQLLGQQTVQPTA